MKNVYSKVKLNRHKQKYGNITDTYSVHFFETNWKEKINGRNSNNGNMRESDCARNEIARDKGLPFLFKSMIVLYLVAINCSVGAFSHSCSL